MELRQLEYFQQVCRLGSVSRAAAQLHVAQPSVSIALQKLEEELGVPLFDRKQRRLRLTQAGERMLQHAETMLRCRNNAQEEMKDYEASRKGRILLGITPVIGAFVFPSLFAAFHSAHPDIELQCTETGSLATRRKLLEDELDLGLLIISDPPPGLALRPLAQSAIHVCLSPAHPLASATTLSLPQLAKEPFLLFQEDTYMRQLILEECSRHGFTPQIRFSSRQIETILSLVEQNAGVGFLPADIARKHPRIVSLPLTPPLSIQAGFAWNEERYLSQACRVLLDFCEKRTNEKFEQE